MRIVRRRPPAIQIQQAVQAHQPHIVAKTQTGRRGAGAQVFVGIGNDFFQRRGGDGPGRAAEILRRSEIAIIAQVFHRPFPVQFLRGEQVVEILRKPRARRAHGQGIKAFHERLRISLRPDPFLIRKEPGEKGFLIDFIAQPLHIGLPGSPVFGPYPAALLHIQFIGLSVGSHRAHPGVPGIQANVPFPAGRPQPLQESGHGEQAAGRCGRYGLHRPPFAENAGVQRHHATGDSFELGGPNGRQIPLPQLQLRVKGRVSGTDILPQRGEFPVFRRPVQQVEQKGGIRRVMAGAMSAEMADIKGLVPLRCRGGNRLRLFIQAINPARLVPVGLYFLAGGLGSQRGSQAQGRKDGQQGGSHDFRGLVASRICRATALRARQNCRKSSQR